MRVAGSTEMLHAVRESTAASPSHRRTSRHVRREHRPPHEEKGHILRWLHRDSGVRWGTDPGAYEPDLVAGTLSRIGALFGERRYFRLESDGWANVPASPVMIVSNHSGGTMFPDVWGLMAGWYGTFGTERPLHVMAHEMVFSTRFTGPYFSQRGVLRAGRDMARSVLEDWRRDILVMPGGDLDTWRPFSKRYQVCFAGRTGYARLALEAGIPIVPVACAGAHETLIVLSDGQRIARALRLPQLARAEIFPIHLSLPWGLAVGPWPHIPTPARFRYRIGKPILPIAHADDIVPAMVRDHDAAVRSSMQSLLDELKASR
jgi:1-acyl-sn-glycerol-3-phosphate acyltransferase